MARTGLASGASARSGPLHMGPCRRQACSGLAALILVSGADDGNSAKGSKLIFKPAEAGSTYVNLGSVEKWFAASAGNAVRCIFRDFRPLLQRSSLFLVFVSNAVPQPCQPGCDIAAVDRDLGAADKTRLVRCQKQHQFGAFLGRALAVQWDRGAGGVREGVAAALE